MSEATAAGQENRLTSRVFPPPYRKLVEEKWGPLGLKAWKVVKVEDEKSPYGVMATIEFESEEM